MEELQFIWGWQPALYLFLGGMGAGAFIAAMVLYFRDGQSHRKIIAASVAAAIACLVVGLLLLVSELIHPLRGMMLWQSFSNFTSWMTFGAWIVFAAVVVYVLALACMDDRLSGLVAKVWKPFMELREKLGRAIGIAGCVLSLCVAVYTGLLLMSAPGVPLWNTWILPCLFTVSALDTGIALVEIIAFALAKQEEMSHKMVRTLEIGVIALVVVELAVLALFLITMSGGNTSEAVLATSSAITASSSAGLLVSGTLAPFFWGLVIVCGLLLPLAAAVACVVRKDLPKTVTLVGACGALVGGCALRFLVLMAGMHANPVLDAMARILS